MCGGLVGFDTLPLHFSYNQATPVVVGASFAVCDALPPPDTAASALGEIASN